MAIVALAAGVSVGGIGGAAMAVPPSLENSAAPLHSNSQGFLKSGNPKASGGPLNPGVGNPHNAY